MSSNLSPALNAMVAFLDVLVLKFVIVASLTKFSPDLKTIFSSFIVNPRSFVNVSWIDPRFIVALLKKSVLLPYPDFFGHPLHLCLGKCVKKVLLNTEK